MLPDDCDTAVSERTGLLISQEVVAWLERNETTATQLQKHLSDGVKGDFGVRWGPTGVDFPETVADHVAAVTLLRTQAEWALERGRMDTGVVALLAAARLIRYNGGDYSLLGFIVRQSEIKSTYEPVQSLLASGRGRLTETQLRDLQRAFAQLSEAPTLSEVLRIDWAAQMDVLRSDSNWVPNYTGNRTLRARFLGFWIGCTYLISDSKSADIYDHFRISDARCEASHGPLVQRQQRSQALDNEVAVILKKWNRPFFRLASGNFPTLNQKELWSIAWVRTVVSTLAVERFRLKYGQLPVDTAALVPEFLPEVLRDPIDNQPLRYRREAGGLVVYSIGANGRDDQGQLGPVDHEDSSATAAGDQGIRVPQFRFLDCGRPNLTSGPE